jgi:hypothetical protein
MVAIRTVCGALAILVCLVFARAESSAPDSGQSLSARQFEAHIAPLLARHCFECHDSASRKGRLDLSRKERALADRKSGKMIVPGNSAESLLWQVVESDEMPEDRPPLSAEDKQRLREWIDSGAVWAAEEIDPLAYTRDTRAAYNWMRRLTVPEYIQTVRSAVGVEIEEEAGRYLPPDVRADGFQNTAYNLAADLQHVEAYVHLAELIVRKVDVPAFGARFSDCKELTDDCMRTLVAGMGKWLFRGPLEPAELEAFLRLSKAVKEEGGGFDEAVGYVMEAMLQSPRFIYRMENQQGDGKRRPAGPYELASRLSYLLWGGPPDQELMKAADAGELAHTQSLQKQVGRMLEDPRAVKRSSRFLYEWLDLDRLSNLRPDPEHFPNWREQLAADMREETLAFFEEIAWRQQRPLAELMNAKVTFLTPRLAEFYGLPAVGVRKRTEPSSKEGLQLLYRFDEGKGDVVRDRAGAGASVDLKINKSAAVEWSKTGLHIKTSATIEPSGSAARLAKALKKSKAASLEVWVTPANASQKGPARILTFSSGADARNFTLGQDAGKYEVRFRTTATDANGLPGLISQEKAARESLTHIVFTRNAEGKARLYINGEEESVRDITGDLSGWKEDFKLVLANETSNDRPWLGTLHLVAIYDRALTREEIRSTSQGQVRFDLASIPNRGGLLTQGSLLTVGGEEASMVARGLFVLQDFLYSRVGNPPPCADTTPVPSRPGLTQRAIAQVRIDNRSCGGCHSKFEPLAFGLEKFDGLGAYHEKDKFGNALREDGEITFPGEEEARSYSTSAELMDLLANSERVQKNMTRKVTQFAIGRPLVESDAATIDKIHHEAQQNGGTYQSLITAIVMSDLVRMVQTEPKPQEQE